MPVSPPSLSIVIWKSSEVYRQVRNYSGPRQNNNLPSSPTSNRHFRPLHVLSVNLQWKGLNPFFISFSWVGIWFNWSSDAAGSLHLAQNSSLLPCVVTQAKYKLQNQTFGLLWSLAAIIFQVPSLLYAWFSAPESTNRWLLVVCAHEWHVRAVKWYLSASQGKAACGSVDQDACLRFWIHD